ncbi:MAG: hypothetical protein LBR90_01635 [Elusimicrobiota bacterium]|jgi:hypothetical protein|nr:hypothetical protein [Elusimicrobiota bacterium]
MTKTYLTLFFAALILSACGGAKNYKTYQGINYQDYERRGQSAAAAQITLEGVQQSDIEAPKFDFEVDAFGNEVIESVGSSYGEAVVAMASKKVFLDKEAQTKDIAVLQRVLDSAYQVAQQQYRPAGFTYSMSPAGTVNPLAVMDVQCILGETSANARGKETCDLFFEEIEKQYALESAKEAQLQ